MNEGWEEWPIGADGSRPEEAGRSEGGVALAAASRRGLGPLLRQRLGSHPKGLAYLTFAEAWERFSFYGMQALLVLYMVDDLFQSGRQSAVFGFAGFRQAVEAVTGPLPDLAFASQVFGLYTGFAYFTPLFGGWIGDRLLGRRRTVVLGAILMATGHLLMALNATFLVALLLLIVGCGCLKGNISAQVGNLYPPQDTRRGSAFMIFNLGINIGAFIAPLICGTLGELYGWHWGFGVAAIGMLVGLAIYVSGYRYLPPDRLSRGPRAYRQPLTSQERRTVAAICAVLVLAGFFSVAHDQCANIFSLWAREKVDRHLFGIEIPVTWFQSLDAGLSVAFTPILLRLWQAQAQKRREQSELTKIGIGSMLGVAANAILALAAWFAGTSGMVPIHWALLYVALLSLGSLFQWPLLLALISRAAPPSVHSLTMGLAFMSIFFTNNIVGWLGRFYSLESAPSFWLMHALISGAGMIGVLVAGPSLERLFSKNAANEGPMDDSMPEAGMASG